jgi:hypothetical protein
MPSQSTDLKTTKNTENKIRKPTTYTKKKKKKKKPAQIQIRKVK